MTVTKTAKLTNTKKFFIGAIIVTLIIITMWTVVKVIAVSAVVKVITNYDEITPVDSKWVMYKDTRVGTDRSYLFKDKIEIPKTFENDLEEIKKLYKSLGFKSFVVQRSSTWGVDYWPSKTKFNMATESVSDIEYDMYILE